MSLCVRERDRSGGMLDSLIPSKGLQGHVSGKVYFVRSRKSYYSEVPDQDTLGLDWIDNGHLDMQGQSSKCSKSQWQYSGWNNEQGIEDGVTPSKPAISKSHASLEDVVNDTTTESQHVAHNNNNDTNNNNIDTADDEMCSWLQYPLDATLERSYCSDFFGSPPESNNQLLKESFAHGVTRTMRPPHSGGSPGVADSRIAAADAAMILGAGRAAGLLPQAGADAFSKVRTLHSIQPSTLKKWNQSMNGSNMVAPTTKTSPSASPTNPMLPPKMQQPVAPHQSPPGNRPGSMNFSHFSRPAAIVKANLHSLAGSLHPTAPPPPNNDRFKPQVERPSVEACTSSGSSAVESITARQEEKVQLEVTEREQSNGLEDLGWQAAPQMSPVKDLPPGGECKSMSPPEKEACRSQVSLATSSGKGVSHVTQHPDIQEPSITSSSGRYGTGAERPKEAPVSIKRKSSDREETECQSEDGEDESVDTKKPATGRGGPTKRSRAAEVHNQSERRRRDRINEKMKALQELIPNSNKTDKASMLDEAIEYLKLLQVQLQMMSMRTGTLPPMVVPSGMQQHMQMSQMAVMPSMGMGMGMMPMGLGMGMMDMGVSAQGRAVMPMPSHAGSSMNGNMASAPNLVDVHDFRYQTPGGVMDSYGAYMARQQQQQQQQHQQQQQPMQMNPALGMDKYNAYLMQHQMQQQQQQQHQQQLQLQPHQQQHQPHQQQHQQHQQQHQPHQHQHQHQPNQQQHQPNQQQHQAHQQQHQQVSPHLHPQHTYQQQAANMNGGPPH